MKAPRPNGSTAVMATRKSPPKALDFFPTPPWATRALIEVLSEHAPELADWYGWVYEPACGEGHMAGTLREFFLDVRSSDVFDYGMGYDVVDFLDPAFEFEPGTALITNPPFNSALDLALKSYRCGVRYTCLLVRLAWIEGAERHRRLFSHHPPALICPFVERVPMVAGRYDPSASSATAYAWVCWIGTATTTRLVWIPPCRSRLEKPEDIERWCKSEPLPLFDGGATC